MVRRREFLAVAATLIAPGAWGQTPGGTTRVTLTTGQGLIVLALATEKAPITAANFLRYVDQKRLDGAEFYRALRTQGAPTTGLIQGGLTNHPERILPPIAHESTNQTGLRHLDGTISLARRAPGTATCDFFICVGDAPYLDADPKAPGDNLGFAAFGQVLEGMDVARRILALPTSPTAGAPDMLGQMLDPAVPILGAARA
jgi:peptidyl-prolyl cis-trans isomerase A (cyclophilin A)